MAKYFVLYHTEFCHLCELAEALIKPYAVHLNLQIELIDIADDLQLMQRYGTSIPVFEHIRSAQQLYWPFDERQLHQFLTQCLA